MITKYLVLALCVVPSVSVVAATVLPKIADICVDDGNTVSGKAVKTLDRDKVATTLLDINQVGIVALDFAQQHANAPPFANITPRQRVIADASFCTASNCSKENKARIDAARATLIMMLSSLPESFENRSGATDPLAFFSDPTARVVCKGPELRDKPTPTGLNLPIRVRGAADALFVDRDLDAPIFASLDKATINLGNDDVLKKRTDKVVGAIGFPFVFPATGTNASDNHGYHVEQWELVPYGGINRNISTIKGKAPNVSANSDDFGLLVDAAVKTSNPNDLHFITGRFNYLIDHRHAAHLASFNTTYTPYVNHGINDFFFLGPIVLRPIFDLRYDVGHYTRVGTSPNSPTFNRVGTKSGLEFGSRDSSWPWDFTVTDTFLYGLRGSPNSLNYFKSTLSLPLDSKPYFSIDISYSDGRREDTALQEKMWSIGFGAKY